MEPAQPARIPALGTAAHQDTEEQRKSHSPQVVLIHPVLGAVILVCVVGVPLRSCHCQTPG
eukprot:423991-Alexandrium_andersonii.AAC.1